MNGINSIVQTSTEENAIKKTNELFPGRESQITELFGFLGARNDGFPPLLIYGSSGTGKSSVVLNSFLPLNRPFSYVNCRSCHSQQAVFESIVNQLVVHKRSKVNNYGSYMKLDKISTFLEALPEAICKSREISSKQETAVSKKEGVKTIQELENKPDTVYLILDGVERLSELGRGITGGLLRIFLRLPELLDDCNIGIIFISSGSWDSLRKGTGDRDPLSIFFPEYSESQLIQILERRHPQSPPYKPFLSSVIPTLIRAVKNLPELSAMADPIYERYKKPIESGAELAPESGPGKSRLFQMVKPFLARIMEDPVQSRFSEESDRSIGSLSVSAKFLLMASYVASRNLPSLDSTVFHFGDSLANKRKRKASAEKKIESEVAEFQKKGPGSFPLERVLQLYKQILRHESDNPFLQNEALLSKKENPSRLPASQIPPPVPKKTRGRPRKVMAASKEPETSVENLKNGAAAFTLVENDVFTCEDMTAQTLVQFATLVASGFIGQSADEILSPGVLFWCKLDRRMADKVAKTIHFPLSKFLPHG